MSYFAVISLLFSAFLLGSRITEFGTETGKSVFVATTEGNRRSWNDGGVEVRRMENRSMRQIPAE
jgi:hypothetical protein